MKTKVDRRVRELLKDEERSIGRPCKLVDSWILDDLVIAVFDSSHASDPDLGTLHERRWAIRTKDGRQSGFVNMEWIKDA